MLLLVVTLSVRVGAQDASPDELTNQPEAVAFISTFTYQGYIEQNAIPVTATCDFQFSLFDALAAGTQVGTTLTRTNVAVSGGIFNVQLEFGAAAFNGQDRYLAVSARCPAGAGVYTALTPRQPMTPVPYAIALYGLRTEPNATSPNIIGGFSGNTVAAGVFGATISGGGQQTSGPNIITASYSTIAGGSGNTVNIGNGAIVGGSGNTINGLGTSSFIGAGANNTIVGGMSVIAGGSFNTTGEGFSTISGGLSNEALFFYSTVGGGQANDAYARGVTIGGGELNRATDLNSTVGGGTNNQAGDAAGTTTDRAFATVSGGQNNTASGAAATVGGGQTNTAQGLRATVGGGFGNTVSADYGTIGGGGRFNLNDAATGNHVTDNYGTIGGGGGNRAGDGAGTTADRTYATVGGGGNNSASGSQATVSGGFGNAASGSAAAVGGGNSNIASGNEAAVGGGFDNTASGSSAVVGGGFDNMAGGTQATVGGGLLNAASGAQSTVGGGAGNHTGGLYSTIPGGSSNSASGDYSFAAGRRARADHAGTFIWADSTDANFSSSFPNQFLVRASGGVAFFTNAAASVGVQVPTGSGTWSSISDRNVKENLEAVDARAVLEALVALPVSTWNYISQGESIRHIGVMAQDFYAAFGVGEDDRHITTIDADGVAFAAIQGLNAKLESENAALRAELDAVQARLAALEGLASGGQSATLLPVALVVGLGVLGLALRRR